MKVYAIIKEKVEKSHTHPKICETGDFVLHLENANKLLIDYLAFLCSSDVSQQYLL